MIKTIIGLLLGLFIGLACRWFDGPVPSPPKRIGALLVVAMTAGTSPRTSCLPPSLTTGEQLRTTQIHAQN